MHPNTIVPLSLLSDAWETGTLLLVGLCVLVYNDLARTKKPQMKIKSPNPFHFRFKDNLLNVWLGHPDEIESEFVLALDKEYLPQFIAILRKAQDT